MNLQTSTSLFHGALGILAFGAATCMAAMPEFSSDAAADQWLRQHSAKYRNMAEFVSKRWGYEFGRNAESTGGMAYIKGGKGCIDLSDSLKGAHRVSVIVFEMTNLFQQDRHEEVTLRVRRGELRDETQFAMLRESIEYDGLRHHREVLVEIAQVAGDLPPEMITWCSSTATKLSSYQLPYAYDYFKAQEGSGHTEHYRRLFKRHAAEVAPQAPASALPHSK